jgi:tetratricopeptide (TPR) repeat protein
MRSIPRPTCYCGKIMALPMFLNRAILPAVCLAVLSLSACGGAETRKAKHMEKGQTFLAAGKFEKARVEFQNALQIAPTDADARYENGVVDERLGKPRDAAQFYQGAIDVNPDHVGALANLARLYLFSGAPDRALELIGPAIEKHPDDAELLTVRAAARLQKKDPDGAMVDALRAVRLAPANEDAVAVLGGLYVSSGRKDEARTLLQESIKRIPGTVDLRLALAQIYAGESNEAETEVILVDLIRLKPDEKSHRIRLAQFYAHTNQVDEGERTLRQAIKDLPEQDSLKLTLVDFIAAHRGPDAAEQQLKTLIAAEPKNTELTFALARFYEANHQTEKAEAIYHGVIDTEGLGSAGLTARDRLAALLVQRKDVPGALTLIGEVLAKSPRDDDALLLRGDIALSKKDTRAAIADLRAVLRDQPNAVGVLRMLARAHLANGEAAIAEETLRGAVEANPQDANLRLEFAKLLSQLGKADQAKPIITDLVKQKPDNLDALDAQYRISMQTRELATAKSAADAIVALRPKLALGHLYEGMIADADKRTEDARREYSLALDLQPDAAEPLEGLVQSLWNAKRTDEALARLDAVAARFPDNAFALNLKGDLLVVGGRAVEAEQAFKLAIARAPKWWKPYRGLANAQLAAKETPAEAIATLRNAEPIVDQGDALGAELAVMLENQGNPDQAIGEYEKIVRRYPQSEVAANNLAMLLATYKRDSVSLDQAKELSARFADSANPSYLDTYGWVLYKRGDAAASVSVLARVVAKSPDAVIARYHLGMAQSQAGDNSDARDNLMRAVKSGTRFSGLDEAKATLDKLAKLPSIAASTPKT